MLPSYKGVAWFQVLTCEMKIFRAGEGRKGGGSMRVQLAQYTSPGTCPSEPVSHTPETNITL